MAVVAQGKLDILSSWLSLKYIVLISFHPWNTTLREAAKRRSNMKYEGDQSCGRPHNDLNTGEYGQTRTITAKRGKQQVVMGSTVAVPRNAREDTHRNGESGLRFGLSNGPPRLTPITSRDCHSS